MIVIKDGIERDITRSRLSEYLASGWTQPGTRKKTAKSAETAPEAAPEDLGNDITQGD
jgi:hypothetical protein